MKIEGKQREQKNQVGWREGGKLSYILRTVSKNIREICSVYTNKNKSINKNVRLETK